MDKKKPAKTSRQKGNPTKKAVRNKPLSIPLDFDSAVDALINTPSKKKPGKPDDSK